MKTSLTKTIIQQKLFQSLVQSDFCLLQNKKPKQISVVHSSIKLNSSKWITSLNLVEVSKSLKHIDKVDKSPAGANANSLLKSAC